MITSKRECSNYHLKALLRRAVIAQQSPEPTIDLAQGEVVLDAQIAADVVEDLACDMGKRHAAFSS